MALNLSYLRKITRAIKVLDKEDGVTMEDLTKYLAPRVCKRYRNHKFAMLGVCATLRQGVEAGKIHVKPERYFLKGESITDAPSSSSYGSVDGRTRSKRKISDPSDCLSNTTHQNSTKKVKQEETVDKGEVLVHTVELKNSIDHIKQLEDTKDSNKDDIEKVKQEETIHEVEVHVLTEEPKNSTDHIQKFDDTKNSNNNDNDIVRSLMYIN